MTSRTWWCCSTSYYVPNSATVPPTQGYGTAMKLLCATNPEQTTYVNHGTGLSNPWLDYITIHSGSWSSTWEKTICKLRLAGLQTTASEEVCTHLNQKTPTDTQHSVLRSEMEWNISPMPWELSGTVSGGSSDNEHLWYVCFISFNQYIVYESVLLKSWTYVGNCLK